MKLSPQYLRAIGEGLCGFHCVRKNDQVLGIRWHMEDDVKVFSIFCGFAHQHARSDRACRQAMSSIDKLASKRRGLSMLLWMKNELYTFIDEITHGGHVDGLWRLKVSGADPQRQKVYARLLRDSRWQKFENDYYFVTEN